METIGLVISCIISLSLLLYLTRKKNKSQLQKIFIIDVILLFSCCILLLLQKYICANFNVNPMIFEYFIYISSSFLPVAVFFTGLIFANTKIKFKKKYILIFIIPVLSLILLWTNDLHHLLYVSYSTNMEETVFGSYATIHSLYTYLLYSIGLTYLLKYAIKNSGLFSRQAILFIIAALIPITVNVLGSLHIIPMSIYMTPICFSFTILILATAVFKFGFTNTTPIALQRVVDRISDSYVVLNEDNKVTDFNKTFLHVFSLKSTDIRNTSIFEWDKSKYLSNLKSILQKTSVSSKTVTLEVHMTSIQKYFNVEVSSIINKNVFLGSLILFKDVTQHMDDLETIKENQDMLIERERFASLGQMIGGIAHNLKTPIMSIAGAVEALNDLIKEYDISIGDPEVTNDDHHDIAKDMSSWVSKIKTHTSYMSDVITAVKGQAVTSNDSAESFTIDELVKRVSILMKHDLKHSLVELNPNIKIDPEFTLHGNINALVQVIDNLISNAIQSYGGSPDNSIDFIIDKDADELIISIKDYGCGMSPEIQDKLFKEMITTKGKNGTGLGLFMSYSNIKAKFNGNITFTSEIGKGSVFSIILPLE